MQSRSFRLASVSIAIFVVAALSYAGTSYRATISDADPVPIAMGGTGAATAGEAKTNLANPTGDIVQLIVRAYTTQTNDLAQFQENDLDPMLRVTNEGNIIYSVHNATTDGKQLYIVNTQSPGAAETLEAIKVDYSSVGAGSGPDLYGIRVVLPASYGTGTEAAGSFNGAGKTVTLAGHWEAGYFGNGTYSVWVLDGSSTGINTNGDMKQRVMTNDVSNPPTDAELDAIFGTPAAVGAGFNSYIDDNGAGTAFYHVASDGTNWWTFAGTKAL